MFFGLGITLRSASLTAHCRLLLPRVAPVCERLSGGTAPEKRTQTAEIPDLWVSQVEEGWNLTPATNPQLML